jgi:hypothetical protein
MDMLLKGWFWLWGLKLTVLGWIGVRSHPPDPVRSGENNCVNWNCEYWERCKNTCVDWDCGYWERMN